MSTTATPETAAAKKSSPKRSKKSPAKKSSKKVIKRNGAVAKAWEIFAKHPKAARKDAVAAAVKAGINISTARTQFQRFLHRKDK